MRDRGPTNSRYLYSRGWSTQFPGNADTQIQGECKILRVEDSHGSEDARLRHVKISGCPGPPDDKTVQVG